MNNSASSTNFWQQMKNGFAMLGRNIKHFFKYLFVKEDDLHPSYSRRFLQKDGVQSVITSVACVIIGLLVGLIVLTIINPNGALEGFRSILLNYFTFSLPNLQLKYFAKTLVSTAPLICTALSVLFAYKAGLFNIGAAGQYVIAIGVCLICAFDGHMSWFGCIVFSVLAAAAYGAIVGALKAYLNVNEVISAIMLNWIGLYTVNMLIKKSSGWDTSKSETFPIETAAPGALLPTCGLDAATGFKYFGIGIFIAIVVAIIILVVISRTTFGFELKASGFNRNAAKYVGIQDKRSTVVTMAISGALAGLGAPLLYLSGMTAYYAPSVVPQMGFDGISAAFLGGLNPIGSIFSSYFLSHISAAGAKLSTEYYCAQTSDLIVGVIIYLCAFSGFFRLILKKHLETKPPKKTKKSGATPAKEGK